MSVTYRWDAVVKGTAGEKRKETIMRANNGDLVNTDMLEYTLIASPEPVDTLMLWNLRPNAIAKHAK
jgi:hypothetical protein